MRNRHTPRLCGSCKAPMAGHEDRCWRCGVEWATEPAPPMTLRLVPAPAQALPAHAVAVAAPIP